MAREKKDIRIEVGDVVVIDSKDVEGTVSFTDMIGRQCKLEGGDATQFYSWEECEIIEKGPGQVAAIPRRANARKTDEEREAEEQAQADGIAAAQEGVTEAAAKKAAAKKAGK